MALAFPRFPSGAVLGYDCETRDPGLEETGAGWAFPEGGEVVGFSIAWDGGRASRYWPIAHAAGGNYPREACLAWLRSQMARTDLTWAMYNRMYDEGWLRRLGIPVRGTVFDVYTAIPLLDEYRYSYKLDDVGFDLLGERKEEAGLLAYGKRYGYRTEKAVKSNLWRFPASAVAPYAAKDPALTLRLWEHVQPLLAAQDLGPIFALETALQPVLLEMRWRGIRVDLDRAERAANAYRKEEARLAARLKTLCGMPVDIWANEDLGRAFDRLGLDYPRTPKTRMPSFRAPWLRDHPHEFAQTLVQYRVLNKTRTTFLESYILAKSVDGRIHPQVNPLPSEEGGAVTGRPSVTQPNMNNLPNVEKDPVNGKLVRGCMLPEVGEEWCASDYSQQEPRLMVHYAGGIHAKGARAAVQAYRDNPRMDFHTMMAELTGLIRKRAKNIFLGKCYGMGGAKYCRDVGLPTQMIQTKRGMLEVAGDEGQAQLDQFAEKVPWVQGLMDECERRARRHGFIRTILGRRARFTGVDYKHGKTDWYYKALNRLIQGSAADQTKKAMVDLWGVGIVPLVTVYDELGVSVPHRGVADQVAEVMAAAVPLRVPVVCDVEIGPSWGEAQ